MKKPEWLSVRIASLKLGTAFLLLLSTGLTSCFERGCDDPSPEPATACNTFATVEDDDCRDGYLGGKWFRLDNGELLMPQGSFVTVPNLVHGQRIMLSFITQQTNPNFKLTCNYIQAPEKPTQGIQITCLEPIGFCGTMPGPQCSVLAVAENVMCGAGVWGSIWLKLDNGTYLQPWESTVNVNELVAGQRYRLGFEKMARDNRYNNQVTCLAMPPAADAVRITCLEPDNYSEATGPK